MTAKTAPALSDPRLGLIPESYRRLTAEPLAREERERLLARVLADGFIDDYAGIRISARGRRFRIAHATVWNLVDGEGRRHGQAAQFGDWHPL